MGAPNSDLLQACTSLKMTLENFGAPQISERHLSDLLAPTFGWGCSAIHLPREFIQSLQAPHSSPDEPKGHVHLEIPRASQTRHGHTQLPTTHFHTLNPGLWTLSLWSLLPFLPFLLWMSSDHPREWDKAGFQFISLSFKPKTCSSLESKALIACVPLQPPHTAAEAICVSKVIESKLQRKYFMQINQA